MLVQRIEHKERLVEEIKNVYIESMDLDLFNKFISQLFQCI
jgi:hypothetical protein